MSNPLLIRLSSAIDLTSADRAVLAQITDRTRSLDAREHVIREDEAPDAVHLIVDGIACRYKMSSEGRRQIMAILAPGDFCDLQAIILSRFDHSVAAITPCVVADIDRETMMDVLTSHPRVARALWWTTLVEEATLRAWLVNMGQRFADRQVAHLFCELLVRLQAVGRADDNAFELSLTPEDIADALGMSAVYVNRLLQQLRVEGLISQSGRRVEIPDVDRFKTFAGFDASYLQLDSVALRPSASELQRAFVLPPNGGG